ncbi:hypothetical protein TWF481_006239 [Arthrobotrys musiformis]|uniref:Homing endonuclease LAGLIDADG domain-containing protein n=1 Tax=Arthrobotrys musiformis TaxID=47236 RepID=A0AAV9WGA3_9PEZI
MKYDNNHCNMYEISISDDGTFDIGKPILDYLEKSLNSSEILVRSFVKLNFGTTSTPDKTVPLVKWGNDGGSGEGQNGSIEIHIVQTNRLDLLDGTISSPYLWQKNTIACLIGIISTSITLEIVGDVGIGLQELGQWTNLIQILGRGSDPCLHWGPPPQLFMQTDQKAHETLLVGEGGALARSSTATREGVSYLRCGSLSFSPTVLKRAFKLLSPIPRPFDGKAWLSNSLGHSKDWVCHTQKFMGLINLETTDRFRLLTSYARLEAKSRQIIYGSSVTTHLSNILNTMGRGNPGVSLPNAVQGFEALAQSNF